MFGRNNSTELHTWVEARLSDYLDQQLPANDHARLEQHLGECAQCRASLEALRWTIALVKQAPVPAARKSFTLPVPAPRSSPSFGFAFARLATAMATLALVATIGIDVITRMGAGAPAPLMAPAAQKRTEPTQAIALAPIPASQPTEAPRMGIASKSASPAVPPASALSATLPAPTKAPAPLPPSAEVSSTQSADTAKAQTQPARAPVAGSGTITPTMVAPTATIAPTQTATPLPTATPAPTMIAQAQRESVSASPVTYSAPSVSPLRLIEIGLFFAVIFFGTLMLLWRRR
jgi:hypothetical protein